MCGCAFTADVKGHFAAERKYGEQLVEVGRTLRHCRTAAAGRLSEESGVDSRKNVRTGGRGGRRQTAASRGFAALLFLLLLAVRVGVVLVLVASRLAARLFGLI